MFFGDKNVLHEPKEMKFLQIQHHVAHETNYTEL